MVLKTAPTTCQQILRLAGTLIALCCASAAAFQRSNAAAHALRCPPITACAASQAELRVQIRTAGQKGQGAFADEACAEGRWVCRYVGELISLEQSSQRYVEEDPEYLFDVGEGMYLDAQLSNHFSRYFNHAEHGNLKFKIDKVNKRVDFHAACDIAVGDELTFDYGVGYWVASRKQPAPGTDSRSFDLPIAGSHQIQRLANKTTPLTLQDVGESDSLPPSERCATLLRALDFFGSGRLPSGEVEIPLGLHDTAARLAVRPDSVDPIVLRNALVQCIIDRDSS
eukprot:2090675-Pleurochrysis_carterae.AAC.2